MINIHADRVDVGSATFADNKNGVDGTWDIEKFKKEFDIKIHNMTDISANFDLIGCDTSLANALRRIMIAEVPSVAVEKVFVEMNSSIMHDEILAQRIGLIPIGVSPDWLEWVDPISEGENLVYTESNCLTFTLNVKCERNPQAAKDEQDPNKKYINSNVYARDLKYVPSDAQSEVMNPPPQVLNPDILLAKLRPGQEIALTAFAVLGIGADHAKFSPVATASYRLLPTITIKEPIEPEHAEKFQKCFSPGVIEIKDGRPAVKDARMDTVSREVLRHPEFKDKVTLGRKRDHFIFNIESTGTMEPDEIFVKSVMILKNKAEELLQCEF